MLLSFDQVSFSYPDVLALDRVSFQLERGEIVGLIGPNGAGKTTAILHVISHLSPKRCDSDLRKTYPGSRMRIFRSISPIRPCSMRTHHAGAPTFLKALYPRTFVHRRGRQRPSWATIWQSICHVQRNKQGGDRIITVEDFELLLADEPLRVGSGS